MKNTSATLKAFKRGTSLERSKWYMGMLLTNLAEASDTSGAFSLFEATLVPGTEPPPHVHSREDELFYVLEGSSTCMWEKKFSRERQENASFSLDSFRIHLLSARLAFAC